MNCEDYHMSSSCIKGLVFAFLKRYSYGIFYHDMSTEFVSVKEWRQHMTTLCQYAQKKRIRFIVMNRHKPMCMVEPIDDTRLEIRPKLGNPGKMVGKSFNFWFDDADDGIFDETVRL